jgi:hypothetical protein
MRALVTVLCCMLAACNGSAVRQAERMRAFEATQWDFDAIARAAFEIIGSKGEVTTIIVGDGLDPRALAALRHLHPTRLAAPGAQGTLDAGTFRVSVFAIVDGTAQLEGQLGPATGRITPAGMPDCGTGYAFLFELEGGDWASHAYKTTTCARSRNWTPLDGSPPPP